LLARPYAERGPNRRKRERLLAGLLGPHGGCSPSSCSSEELERVPASVRRRLVVHLRDDCAAAARAAHAPARSETEPSATRHVLHGARPLVLHDVAHLRLRHRLARTDDRGLARLLPEPLDDPEGAASVTV